MFAAFPELAAEAHTSAFLEDLIPDGGYEFDIPFSKDVSEYTMQVSENEFAVSFQYRAPKGVSVIAMGSALPPLTWSRPLDIRSAQTSRFVLMVESENRANHKSYTINIMKGFLFFFNSSGTFFPPFCIP